MFTTLTLNPCIDRTTYIRGLTYGEYNAVVQSNVDISGKGINVSVCCAQLGLPTHAVYYNYLNDKDTVPGFLAEKGVPGTAIDVPGSIRMNIKLFDLESSVMTECNEKGTPVSEEAVQMAYDAVLDQIDASTAVILTGSVPPGVPTDFYYKLILEIKKRGKIAFLDADKDLLIKGVEAIPDYIKPNRSELQRLVGRELRSNDAIIDAAQDLLRKGIKHICVSMGGDGALMCDETGVVYAKPSKIDVRGVQGAGDSLVTGILMAITEGLGLEDTLRYAVAVANGSLIREGTLMCTPENFRMMLPLVEVERIR